MLVILLAGYIDPPLSESFFRECPEAMLRHILKRKHHGHADVALNVRTAFRRWDGGFDLCR
jgi:hypothetical protein